MLARHVWLIEILFSTALLKPLQRSLHQGLTKTFEQADVQMAATFETNIVSVGNPPQVYHIAYQHSLWC